MAVAVRSVGAAATPVTATPLIIPTPASVVAGDLLVAVIEAGATSGISLAGWVQVFLNSRIAAVGNTVLVILVKPQADGTEGASQSFAVAGTINHAIGRMMSISGHGMTAANSGTIGTANSGAASGVNPQNISVNSVNVVPNSLVIMAASTALDATSTTQFGNYVNANLTGITERMDDVTISGNGGGIGVATGLCAGSTTGASTLDEAVNEAYNTVHLAVPPPLASPFKRDPMKNWLRR